jgi:hypothetical protein
MQAQGLGLRLRRPRRPTDQAVVMLAEAVWAAFCAADAAATSGRESRTSFRRSAWPYGVFALFAQGSAGGRGERRAGAEQIRQAVEILGVHDGLHDDPRLLAWAAMGSPWLRQAHLAWLGDCALAAARSQSAVGVCRRAHSGVHRRRR